MDDELKRRITVRPERRATAIDSTIRRPVHTQSKTSYYGVNRQTTEQQTSVAVSRNPSVPQIVNKHKSINKRKHLIIGVFIFFVVLSGLGLYLFIFSNKSVADKNGPPLVTDLSKPNFTPLVPQGESQLASQNASTSFNRTQDSYTFKDLYLGVPITVSEQPMPSNSNSNITSGEVIDSLVKKYSVNTEINYLGGKAYVANVSATNKQLIIFDYKGILVFIQSNMNIQDDAWVTYIDNLYQP